ncbi:MAG: hypothetical protein AB1Z22_09370 [Synechococcaceae cyanobacterium]
MNLVEVLVAGSLVLGSGTASLGIWARTAQATHSAEDLQAQQRAADARLLAVQARLQALAAERRAGNEPVPAFCPGLPELLPPAGTAAAAGEVTEESELSGEILRVAVAFADGQRRERVFDLAAYGLCGGAP